tara:strand:+ start:1055 stop:1762 length:708 start_codon:yes stop_codon:yes gene_type:complete
LKKKFIAIIPARKGSKRLKNKNIITLKGKPLIAHTIESALDCKVIDEVIVSTDCPKIREVSQNFGASLPFIRPSYIAQDESSTADVVMHAISFFEHRSIYFENFILLQPTSPLRDQNHISSSIDLMQEKKAKAVVSVCPCNEISTWSGTLGKDNSMENFLEDKTYISKEQDKNSINLYRLNGAIYIQNIENFKQYRTFISPNMCYAYIMNERVSVDIDHHSDFLMAQKYLEDRNE